MQAEFLMRTRTQQLIQYLFAQVSRTNSKIYNQIESMNLIRFKTLNEVRKTFVYLKQKLFFLLKYKHVVKN